SPRASSAELQIPNRDRDSIFLRRLSENPSSANACCLSCASPRSRSNCSLRPAWQTIPRRGIAQSRSHLVSCNTEKGKSSLSGTSPSVRVPYAHSTLECGSPAAAFCCRSLPAGVDGPLTIRLFFAYSSCCRNSPLLEDLC